MATSLPNDPIFQAVENCCSKLHEDFDEAHLIVVHFLCGRTKTPGAIRNSAVFIKDGSNNGDGDFQQTPVNVLRDHIREFDREGIFLSIVEEWATNSTSSNNLILTIQRDKDLAGVSLSFESLEEAYNRIGSRSAILSLSDQLITELCPKDLVISYMQKLYEGEKNEIEHYKEFFDLRRAASFGMGKLIESNELHACNFVADQNPESKGISNKEYILWRLFGGLQSALLYFLSSYTKSRWTLERKVKVFIHKCGDAAGVDAMLIGFIYPCNAHINRSGVVFQNFDRTWQQIEKHLIPQECNLTNKTFTRFYGSESQSKDSQQKLQEIVYKLFPINIQQKIASRVTNWLTWLVQELEGRKHEGHPLDFWFVIGDRTQFEDSSWLIPRSFVDLQDMLRMDFNRAVAPLAIPKRTAEADYNKGVMRQLVRFLSGEHYPWFQNGKYALFWDVTNVQLNDIVPALPYGLMGISGSNWEQFLSQHYTHSNRIHLPANVLVYTKGSPSDSGMLITYGDGRPPERVLYMRDGLWRLSTADERATHLTNKVLGHPVIHDGSLRDKISEIILRVADNPLQGGTLIILKEDANPKGFTRMGIPWKFSTDPQDIEALMSHDGASILQEKMENGRRRTEWDFRLLLSAEGVSAKLRHELEAKAHDIASDFPLSGAGSRRWSAALTALRKDVQAVIVISQDGDITCWLSSRNNLPPALHILRQGGKPEVKQLDMGKIEMGAGRKSTIASNRIKRTGNSNIQTIKRAAKP